jgi:hypothetical protein
VDIGHDLDFHERGMQGSLRFVVSILDHDRDGDPERQADIEH